MSDPNGKQVRHVQINQTIRQTSRNKLIKIGYKWICVYIYIYIYIYLFIYTPISIYGFYMDRYWVDMDEDR